MSQYQNLINSMKTIDKLFRLNMLFREILTKNIIIITQIKVIL